MNDTSNTARYATEESAVALHLLAVDPAGLGGIALSGMPGPGRSAAIELLAELLGDKHPIVHVPINASDDRLLGGLDIAATLASGKPLSERGLLEQADGGLAVLAMAERLSERTVAVLAQALDTHRVMIERDGVSAVRPCRFGVVALDESLADDEKLAEPLADRLAFRLWTDRLSPADLRAFPVNPDDVQRARAKLASVVVGDDVLGAIAQTALALGVDSLRPTTMTVAAARALAALSGEREITQSHAEQAVRLVLSHRALVYAAPESAEQETPPESPPESNTDDEQMADAPPPPPPDFEPGDADDASDAPLESDMSDVFAEAVVEAAKAALPGQLLKTLANGMPQKTKRAGRGAKARSATHTRGRPIGVRAVTRLGDARLNILATAKAAAPWQRLRHAEVGRLKVYPDDFRITRFQSKTQTTTIFAVDASGSSAARRLAEVKGAVELLLAECYVSRAQVAVVAFRKSHAEVLLAPTRSLTRAKRQLSGLPGGGATPLANAIDVTRELCDQALSQGHQPAVVILTDGRGNVGRDGTLGHPDSTAHALDAARDMSTLNVATILVDTSRRPRARARELATALGARYLPLPYADADALAGAVGAAA